MAGIKEIGEGRIPLELPEAGQTRSKSSFSQYLRSCIEGVDRLQQEADKATGEIATGTAESVHQAMIAMEKADVSFRMMVEVRNRIVRAYEEILKMQV
jgi:flagellar hook-basal body complex protein FliE